MTTTGTNMIVTTDHGFFHGYVTTAADGTEEEIKIRDIAGALKSAGDILEGHHIKRIQVQCAEPSALTVCRIYSSAGTMIASWRGSRRPIITTPIGYGDPSNNLDVAGLNIAVMRSMTIKVNTAN